VASALAFVALSIAELVARLDSPASLTGQPVIGADPDMVPPFNLSLVTSPR